MDHDLLFANVASTAIQPLYGRFTADWTYKDRSDLAPPHLNITIRHEEYLEDRYHFAIQGAPYIMTDSRDLVWSRFTYLSIWAGDFQAAKWKGRDVLTALTQIYHPIPVDLSPDGALPEQQWIVDARFRELDIATGRLLFKWSSLGHVEPFETINGTTSGIIWRLGGHFTDSDLGPEVEFGFQHHARYLTSPRSTGNDTISLFDNSVYGSESGVDGTPIFYGFLDSDFLQGVQKFRAFRFNWTGYSDETPTAVCLYDYRTEETTAYVSWNGDTQTKFWRFYAITETGHIALLGQVKRTEPETAFRIGSTKVQSIEAEAQHVTGAVLVTGEGVRLSQEVLQAHAAQSVPLVSYPAQQPLT
ncbi:hypothetical protein BDV97DRAFT_374784 [Delphinella strobiligena]|nr:hypothetical protein BDV97DRAFT_374784 [Delphinella strobiligena]